MFCCAALCLSGIVGVSEVWSYLPVHQHWGSSCRLHWENHWRLIRHWKENTEKKKKSQTHCPSPYIIYCFQIHVMHRLPTSFLPYSVSIPVSHRPAKWWQPPSLCWGRCLLRHWWQPYETCKKWRASALKSKYTHIRIILKNAFWPVLAGKASDARLNVFSKRWGNANLIAFLQSQFQ